MGEPEGRGAGWLMLDQGGAGLTREPGRASGLPGHGGTDESMCQGGVWGLEAGDEGKGFSSHDDNEGWQTHRACNVQMVG